MKRKLIILIILLAGVSLLSYPAISNLVVEINGSTAIQELNEEVKKTDTTELKRQLKLAKEYNNSLTGQNIKDPFVANSGIVFQDNYNEILDFANHIMGYIEIPKINVNLPIYHGTDDDVLAKGVGHISDTAFPIGGEGNHAVLTGHTGLTKAKLFTDLTKLDNGDIFYINILDRTLCYKIDQIKVVEPSDTSNLLPVSGKDYVTLITCTPYGVNSHRLIVRGTRVPYVEAEHQKTVSNITTPSMTNLIIFISIAAVLVIIIVFIIIIIKKHNRNSKITKIEWGGDDD